MRHAARLEPADVAVLETFVVPRYLSLFGEAIYDAFDPKLGGDVVHLGCRTGYPDAMLAERLGEGRIVGVDPSPAAIELARAKASAMGATRASYQVFSGSPAPFAAASFRHGIALHPDPRPVAIEALAAELGRLVSKGGEAIVAMPLAGTLQEVLDLAREHALKRGDDELSTALDSADRARASADALGASLARAGFVEPRVDVRKTTIEFGAGRDLFEDPAFRLLLLPELESLVEVADLRPALEYVRAAIDRYWSGSRFSLTVVVGCARALRG